MPKLTPGDFQCGACDLIFASDRAFQAHRVGGWDKRRCLTPAEIQAKAHPDGTPYFTLGRKGRWTINPKVPAAAMPLTHAGGPQKRG